MLAEMDPDDWAEWPQFAELEPFGATMEGLYHGTVASLFYNANRGKNAEALLPEDFFPHLKRASQAEKTEPSPEQAARAAERLKWMCKIQTWKERTALPPTDQAWKERTALPPNAPAGS